MTKRTLLAAGVLFAACAALQTAPAAAGSLPAGFDAYYEPAPDTAFEYGTNYEQMPVYSPRRSSCYRAHRTVRDHGYQKIRTVDCKGRIYTFHARRDGRWWKVKVRARNGRIRRVYPL